MLDRHDASKNHPIGGISVPLYEVTPGQKTNIRKLLGDPEKVMELFGDTAKSRIEVMWITNRYTSGSERSYGEDRGWKGRAELQVRCNGGLPIGGDQPGCYSHFSQQQELPKLLRHVVSRVSAGVAPQLHSPITFIWIKFSWHVVFV